MRRAAQGVLRRAQRQVLNGMDESTFNKPAELRTIRQLREDGLLSDEACHAALRILRPASSWFAWAERNLLFFGSGLTLAGIIFFFAYNWAAMGKFLKFGVIEAGMAACVIGSFFLGLRQLAGKILLLSGAVLLGVLLAVYGQAYQTGADAYELFFGWAMLICGWVVVAEFAALWVVWLILINTGTILYWMQVIEPTHAERYEYLYLALAALNGIALVLRELGAKNGCHWLAGRWLRGSLLAVTLTALTIPPMALIFDFGHNHSTVLAVASLAWPIVSLGGYICYRYMLQDMVALALIIMNACLLLLTFIGQLMLDHTGYDAAFMFLLFALMIIGVVSTAAFWLKITAAKMAKESSK
jgi:uncharacterized membrane protein